MGTILDRRGPIQRVFKAAENLAEARRQVALATAQATASALNASNSFAARDATFGYAHFYATRAEGVAAVGVGEYFTSSETGSPRTYKRTGSTPFYVDQGDAAAPVSKAALGFATGGSISLEQFAAPGFSYYNGPTDRGTDWSGPLAAALAAINKYAPVNAIWARVPRIELKLGAYWFGGEIDLKVACHLHGQGTGIHDFNGGTRFIFPAGSRGITINDADTRAGGVEAVSTSAMGTVIEGISVEAETKSGTGFDWTNVGTNTCGIWMRSTATIRNCQVKRFKGNAVQIPNSVNGAVGWGNPALQGNASGWCIDGLTTHECDGYGVYVWGGDSNGGSLRGLMLQANGMGGIVDDNTFGNNYSDCVLQGYAFLTQPLVIRAACSYGGINYSLIDPTPGIGAATTPGTNSNVWYPLETGAPSDFYLAWDNTKTYLCMSPILCRGASNHSVFKGIYVEGGQPSHMADSNAVAIGGLAVWTRTSRKISGRSDGTSAVYNSTGWAERKFSAPGSSDITNYGSYHEAGVGGSYSPGVIYYGRTARDGEADYLERFAENGEIIFERSGSTNGPLKRISTPVSDLRFGTSANIPFVVTHPNMALGNPTDPTLYRRIWSGSVAPTTGEHAAGERLWNAAPGPGKPEYWLCVASGTPGTWIGVDVAPFLSGSAIPLTGSTTLTTLVDLSIPGGTLGPKGLIDVDMVFSMTGTAGTKTPSVQFGSGGATFWTIAYGATLTQARAITRVSNQGSVSAQVGGLTTGAGTGSNAGGTPTKTTLNTALAQSLKITGQLANAADTLVLESYAVRITPGV